MKGRSMDDIEILENKLKKSKDNIHLYDKKTPIDRIENIKIDTNLPIAERIYNFLNQVNNPYLLQIGKIIVEMEFSENSNISPIECIDEALIKECNNKKIVNV